MKKIYNLLFLLTALIGYTSCTGEVDDVFDKPSSQRIEETIKNTEEILKANTNGWIMKYYANPIYGGYNVFCKFNQNKTVTILSEVFGEDEERTTHYKFEQSQGAILSFDEYNEIFNYFSDPANPDGIGTNGKGMQGDFEFRIQTASADSIVMLGKKNNSKIVMTPMSENATWSSYYQKISDNKRNLDSKSYMLVIDGDTITGTKSYNQLSFIDPETESNIDMPFIFTSTGLELYKPMEYKGKIINSFMYSEAAESWKSTSDSNITLIGIVTPLNEQFVDGDWFFKKSDIGSYGLPYFNVAVNAQKALEEEMLYCFMGSALYGTFGFNFNSSGYGGVLNYNYKLIGEDKIILTFALTGGGDGVWYYSNCKFNYITSAIGGSGSRTYTITADNKKTPSYIILTEDSNPNNTYKLYASQVTYPFR